MLEEYNNSFQNRFMHIAPLSELKQEAAKVIPPSKSTLDALKLELKDLITKFYPILQDNEIEQFLTITKYKKVKKKEIVLKSGKTDKKFLF